MREPPIGSLRSEPDVRDLVTMRRALRTGLFIGTLIGMSACAMAPDDGASRGA